MGTPTVFLDTSVLKHASEFVVRGFRRRVQIKGRGDEAFAVNSTTFRPVSKRPITGHALAADVSWLPLLAELATRGVIVLRSHLDGALELGRLPDIDSPLGRFYGAPIEFVQPPFTGHRMIFGMGISAQEHQARFVTGIRDPRFLALARAVGAQPRAKNYTNQLLDAYHVFTAESCHAEYFLTTDYKLQRLFAQHRSTSPTLEVVRPSELVRVLWESGRIKKLGMMHALVKSRLRVVMMERAAWQRISRPSI